MSEEDKEEPIFKGTIPLLALFEGEILERMTRCSIVTMGLRMSRKVLPSTINRFGNQVVIYYSYFNQKWFLLTYLEISNSI